MHAALAGADRKRNPVGIRFGRIKTRVFNRFGRRPNGVLNKRIKLMRTVTTVVKIFNFVGALKRMRRSIKRGDGAFTGKTACETLGKRFDPDADHAFVRDVQLRAADLEPFLRRTRRLKLQALAR